VAHYTHRLLLLIDEFASLKRLTAVEEALAHMAGYGLKAYLIVQDLQQIFSAYGREEDLTGNCHIRIAYAPNKLETAEILSRMAGMTTVMKRTRRDPQRDALWTWEGSCARGEATTDHTR